MRAGQLSLGQTKIARIVRYPGIDLDDTEALVTQTAQPVPVDGGDEVGQVADARGNLGEFLRNRAEVARPGPPPVRP